MPLRVLTLIGTRPELIKLSRVIAVLDDCVEHVLVHTGQNYDFELNEIFFKELGIRTPDHFLGAAGVTAAETIGQVIQRVDTILADKKPDAFLLLGDTNSCLGAIAAKRRKIPIFHMEAGNRCFDQRVPEEINRKIVDHVSDINLTYTEHARRYLLDEGIRPETVIKTGSPMQEVLTYHAVDIQRSDVMQRLGLRPREFFLVSAHREENVDDPQMLSSLVASIDCLARHYEEPVIVSTHPRTRRRLDEAGIGNFDARVQFMKPLGFFDYVKLQSEAHCVVSDSGTITEESSLLGFPAITIRQAHERPEGMDTGVLVMADPTPNRILDAVDLVVAQSTANPGDRLVPDYNCGRVSEKVVRIILSYTDYVNRTVWYK